MGIPNSAFRAGDVYIEYAFENVLFRYEKKSDRYFRKFYDKSREDECEYNNKLFHDATLSGVMTTAERYKSGGAPVDDPAAGSFSRLAVRYQRIRPYWATLMQLKNFASLGRIELGTDGRLKVIPEAGSNTELLEKVVSEINSQPCFIVTWRNEASITVDKQSRDFDFGLHLELKKRGLTFMTESSYYHGRSGP
ncbi:MAG: hypothetical protein ACRDGA_04960 [Bacteroidota bacterium]